MLPEDEFVEMVRRCFHYGPKGFLVWVWHPNSSAMSRFVGKRFGSANTLGYRQGSFLGVKWLEHHLAWIFHHGKLVPRGMELDHINHIRDDNRIENLRIATTAENKRNRSLDKRNYSDTRGVYRHQGKWQASISVGGQRIYLGKFIDLADARAARLRAEAIYYGEFASEDAKALARRRF